MGPMTRGPKLDRRRVTKLAVFGILAMFLWSLIAAPSSTGQDEEPIEPDELSAYFTFADAAPIGLYFDHQGLITLAPATGAGVARSSTEVALPSAASGIAWLLDGGIAGQGVHGTTTGAAVPTEASAKQPGGAASAEFTSAGGPIGEDEFGRASAGVARASATRTGTPRGFAHSYVGNLYLLPAAGSPPEPPGTYDPDGTFPGGANQSPIPDPAPRGQMAILAIGSIASTTESVRSGDTVTSIGVAELTGINIGNRTSDNRCTNCITISGIRVETYARTNGQPGGSRAGYRVMLGRSCLRQFRPSTTDNAVETVEKGLHEQVEQVPPPDEIKPYEADRCLQPGDPRGPNPEEPGAQGNYALDGSEEHIAQFNDFFGQPIIIPLPKEACGGQDCIASVRITVGQPGNADQQRTERTLSPPDDPCRNYAYPDPDPKAKPVAACEQLDESIRPKTGPDRDAGQEAKAVAEGIDIEITTLIGAQFIPRSAEEGDFIDMLDHCLDGQIPDSVKDNAAYETLNSRAGCPIPGLRAVRTLNVTLGVAQAGAVARPGFEFGDGGGGDDGGLIDVPPIGGPIGGGPIIGGDTGGGGGPVTVVGGGGLGAGKYALKIDWSSLRIRPWKAKDMAKGILVGGIVGGMVLLIRRRLRFGAG